MLKITGQRFDTFPYCNSVGVMKLTTILAMVARQIKMMWRHKRACCCFGDASVTSATRTFRW